MGFNLKMFFEELLDKISHCKSHVELLDYVKAMQEYARLCGKL